MNLKPLISVIIPAYNAQKWISQCVNSILEQTYTKYEIIIINDGSNDNTASVCRQLSASDSRIKYIEQQNGGPNSARNTGLRASRGEIITFADADDIFYSSDTFELNLKPLLNNSNIDIVSMPQYLEQSNGKLSTKPAQFKRRILTDKRDVFINWYCSTLIDATFPGKLFRRELFNGWQFIETIRYTEDAYNIPDICQRCHSVLLSGAGGYVYKYNKSSCIHAPYTNFKRFSNLQSIIRICEYFDQLKNCDFYRNTRYLEALEEAYYLINTEYESEALSIITKAHTKYPYGKKNKLQLLLSLGTLILGPTKGLKLIRKCLDSIYHR